MEPKYSKYLPVVTCVTSAVLLAGFGLVCLYSALRGSLVVPVDILNKQAVLLLVAMLGGVFVSMLPERLLCRFAFAGYVGAVVLLTLVLIPGLGVEINGARRWLDLGFTRFQVSEVAKPLFVVGFAVYLANMSRRKNHWFLGFLLPVLMIGVFAALILKEPDYGTAFLFVVMGMTMLYLWGTRMDLLVISGTIGLAIFGVLIRLDPVRWKRIVSFLDVDANKSDGTYQLYQGLLAFGSGGWTGVGIGNGRQQQAYLPEAHTDFILPVIGEELGLFATWAIVLLFGCLFVSILRIANEAGSVFWYMITVGAGGFVIMQFLFNVAVVTGLVPTKGIPLPFISYGGANLIASFALVGLLVCAWRHNFKPTEFKAREV